MVKLKDRTFLQTLKCLYSYTYFDFMIFLALKAKSEYS